MAKTVVVVQQVPAARAACVEALDAAGYSVLTCAGPEPPEYFCPALKFCGCLECEQADAMVYDPCLMDHGAVDCSERIIYRLREWYPEKPVLVLNRGGLPEPLRRLAREDPGVILVATTDPGQLVQSLAVALQQEATEPELA